MFNVETLPGWKLAYIAGIVDGEGSIGIGKGKNMCLKPEVYVGMTDPACINALYNNTEVGNMGSCSREKLLHKRIYTWRVKGKLEIYVLLKALRPYLITKKKQVDVLMEFIERRMLDVPQSSYDDQLRDKLMTLNK